MSGTQVGEVVGTTEGDGHDVVDVDAFTWQEGQATQGTDTTAGGYHDEACASPCASAGAGGSHQSSPVDNLVNQVTVPRLPL